MGKKHSYYSFTTSEKENGSKMSNLPAWRFPAIGSVLPSVSISAQGASICITSSCAFKQEDLWSYDWSMAIVMQSEKTLRCDVSTCFDFLFWEIEEQQLAKVRFKMKRTKVCSFDFFLENTGTTTGQSPFDNATRTSLVSISSSSKNTTYFLAKYHGNRSKRVN